jgi:hypothetical protein
VLVFVYWLGGDLGAFYTSRFLIQPDVSADRRLMAAKVVNDVDMAPRTALILTLPTGLALAESKAWVSLGWPAVIAVGIGAALWLILAWHLHLKHGGASDALNKLDRAIRWGLVLGLGSWAIAGLSGAVSLPLFLALKLLVLVGCILLGLLIRSVLKPLGPALMGLNAPDGAAAATSLARTLNRARPLVTGIWALLIIAAFLGLWTPTTF